jgi:hypothetical protein
VVAADTFCEMPGGRVPEVIAQEYGLQPLLALMTAEYALFTVPFGSLRVLIVMLAKHCEQNKATRRESRGSLISHAGVTTGLLNR